MNGVDIIYTGILSIYWQHMYRHVSKVPCAAALIVTFVNKPFILNVELEQNKHVFSQSWLLGF